LGIYCPDCKISPGLGNSVHVMKIMECAVALQPFREAFIILNEKTMSGQRGIRGGHDSWEEHSGASGGEIERLKRDLEEANRRADTVQERLNLQKQATVQAGIPQYRTIKKPEPLYFNYLILCKIRIISGF
jgi:hypothetical protein